MAIYQVIDAGHRLIVGLASEEPFRYTCITNIVKTWQGEAVDTNSAIREARHAWFMRNLDRRG